MREHTLRELTPRELTLKEAAIVSGGGGLLGGLGPAFVFPSAVDTAGPTVDGPVGAGELLISMVDPRSTF